MAGGVIPDHPDGEPTGYTCNACEAKPAVLVRWLRGELGDSVVHACSPACADIVRIVRKARFIKQPRSAADRAILEAQT